MDFNNKPWTPRDVRDYLSGLTKIDLSERQWELLSRQDWFEQLVTSPEPRLLLIDAGLAFLMDCIALGFRRSNPQAPWEPTQSDMAVLLSEKGHEYAKAWLVADSARFKEFELIKKWRTTEVPIISEMGLLKHLMAIQQEEYEDGIASVEPGWSLGQAGVVWVSDGSGGVIDLPYFCRNGTLAELSKDSEELAEKYSWTRSGAVSFIFIVREVPHLLPIQAQRKGRRIKLSIDISTSPRDVMKAYSELRSEAVTHFRDVGKKNTLLAYLALGPWKRLTWAERMKRFNDECGSLSETGSPLYTDLRFFKRDAIDSAKRLLNPFGLTPDIDAKDIEER